jgi:outer membrane receptor protein involved in Fe transport
MCERASVVLSAIFACTLSLNASTLFADSTSPAGALPAAGAEIKSHFDLPAEPLDKSLRDFALQAHINISYEPSIVAGLRAPAINGEFRPADALSILLKGTRLVPVNINEDTIQVVEKPVSTSQEAASGDTEAHEKKELEEIVVTGTHILGVPSASPVIEIGQEEIDRSGFTSISDVMLSLPQNFGGGYNPGTTVGNSQVNNRFGDNPTGASVPNLRGLGPGSTLTLIDGHRMASGLTGGGSDISSIPIDAIERIEVVTDSASSIYGSDAVAGVVNIILKRDYDGAKTSVSYGLATQGGGTEKRASQLFGTSWNGGNIMVAYEHAQQDAVDARDRAFTSSALDPYSLLPETQSNALTVSATQHISATTSVFVDGLYIARDANSFVSQAGFVAPFDYPSTLRKYAVAAGLDHNLWSDWKLTLSANSAEDVTDDNSNFLTLPSISPASDERQVGILRAVEASANGTIADLPSGTVRLAVGAGYRQESYSDDLGTTGGPFTDWTYGDRNIRYAFGELSIPLVEHSQQVGLNYLDLTISGRDERYSDFGHKAVPKLGIVYAPSESIKLRSTWGKAFKAPNLYDIDSVQQLILLDLPNPASSTGISPVMVKGGGNPALQPETADAWSIGLDYSPLQANDLQLSTNVFDIKYTNRISQIANPFAALTDPLNAFFVTRAPSTSLIQSLYNSYPPNQIFNNTSGPFNIDSTAAILEYQLVNVARQVARGVDANVNYKLGTDSNGALFFVNGSYLDLTQQDTPQSPSETLSGLAFFPAKFRSRGGASWKLNAWDLTGTVNYLARETDTQVTPIQSVGSWTTIDASLRYSPTLSGFFSGLHFRLAAINLFDRDPPRTLVPETVGGPKLDYDSSNTSPLGRFVSLTISKTW